MALRFVRETRRSNTSLPHRWTLGRCTVFRRRLCRPRARDWPDRRLRLWRTSVGMETRTRSSSSCRRRRRGPGTSRAQRRSCRGLKKGVSNCGSLKGRQEFRTDAFSNKLDDVESEKTVINTPCRAIENITTVLKILKAKRRYDESNVASECLRQSLTPHVTVT